MKIQALIIEDELPARTTLKMYLKRYYPFIEIKGEIDNVSESIQFINNNEFEILFLDVQLKDGKTIDFIHNVDLGKSRIIFTTAFENYAFDAFKIKSFGYLLKPLDPDDFKEIMDRVLRDLDIKEEPVLKVAVNNGFKWIKINSIIRCESNSNYTTLYCDDAKSYTISKTLKNVEQQFANSNFIRIHQSHLINLEFIKETILINNHISLINGEQIPVSRSKRNLLINSFNNQP